MSSSTDVLLGEPLVGAFTLLRRCRDALDAQSLGALVAVLQESLYAARPRAGTMALILASSLEALLEDAEFVEGVGRARLHSARLLRVAFAGATAAAAIGAVAGMASAGALNIYSRSALRALHAGMVGWRAETAAELVGRLCEGVDSFAQAGLFLSLLLASPASRLSRDEACALVCAVVAREDVRDLAGRVDELLLQLPRDVADAAADAVAARNSSDDEDEDEDGNLRGFVVYSEDEDEDASDASSGGGGDSDGSGGDGSSGGSGSGSGRRGAKRRRRSRSSSASEDSSGAGPPRKRARARPQMTSQSRAAAFRARYADLEASHE
jgi:hypothetical protein